MSMSGRPRYICRNGDVEARFFGEEIAAAMFLYWLGEDRFPDGKVDSVKQSETVKELLLTGRLEHGNVSVVDEEKHGKQ